MTPPSMLKNIPTLGIVVPCYNEEEVLTETNARLTRLLTSMIETSLIAEQSAIYYVDDGSRDKTWALIEKFSKNNPLVCGVKLSCNRGHQNALWCGLMTVPGDILVSIDADLQDDINVIPKMVNEFLDGKEIVYGVRDSRASDTFFKRFSAELFYKLMKVMGVDLVFNHADYRLLSRRALDALSEYQEVNLFLRGIVRLLGFTSSIVKYDRAERFAGESKYPLKKMLAFAWQGISSFSIVPLRLITLLGFAISLLSIFFGLWGLGVSLVGDYVVPGWASTVVPMYFLGGVQLLGLGVIGEYIGKIYLESKHRPRFHIEKIIERDRSK